MPDENENLYDAPPEEPTSNQDSEQPKEEQAGQLVNREVWPDAKPGESKTFRCLKVMDKELELVAEDGEEQGEEAPPMPEGGEDSMMG